jgi:hypothetical protein
MGKFILGVGLVVGANATGDGAVSRPDPRLVKLEDFFRGYNCPQPYHISDYVNAADANGIDYRLLPALSVRESGCGRAGRLSNYWGWDSAHSGFSSVKAGIYYVSERLAKSPLYRGKSLEQKLHRYNPRHRYAREVKRLMGRIELLGPEKFTAGL